MMKHKLTIVAALLVMIPLITALTGCKTEKKNTAYKGIYDERPVTLYIAPLQDNSQRKEEKYATDVDFNRQHDVAARFLKLTLSRPLETQGYYVLPWLSAQQIASTDTTTPQALANGDLLRYAQLYGIDALLNVHIHRWKDTGEETILFIEYQLRSCKSNHDLMHSWVRASLKNQVDYKGESVASPEERLLMMDYGFDINTARRCHLVQAVSDHVLHDLPFSAKKRQFERDRYRTANQDYYTFKLTESGEFEKQTITMEAFEEECFIN